ILYKGTDYNCCTYSVLKAAKPEGCIQPRSPIPLGVSLSYLMLPSWFCYSQAIFQDQIDLIR
uniref:Uncharacterized protein n=1 Tax=Romanomermis culicivorax TaxID=13658 RepID=A0A915L4X5_ROMCU